MTEAPAARGALGGYASSVLIVVGLFLGWQIVREAVAQRFPVEVAVRVSPSSPDVLARAAESEFAAERYDNASYLARESLALAPFNARAMRVAGLALATAGGDVNQAEQIIIQAGNWSLRDDPAHAWLIERLLRKGDYASAFAHADTLARRRSDLWPQVFNLFQTAAATDPRAFPALVSLVKSRPPWRGEFFTHLSRSPTGLAVSVNLAVVLERTDAPVSDDELSQLYRQLMTSRMLPGMAIVRKALGRPPENITIVGGSFPVSGASQLAPFGWEFPAASGIVSDIFPDDLRPSETALRVQYNGFAISKIADQLIQLSPGSYRLSGEARAESGETEDRLAWRVICLETDTIIAQARSAAWPRDEWSRFQTDFRVPETNCSAQWLRLEPLAADQTSDVTIWYDRLSIAPLTVARAAQ